MSARPYSMSTPEAARYVGLSERKIRQLIDDGRLDVRREGRRVLVLTDSLESYVDALPSERQAS